MVIMMIIIIVHSILRETISSGHGLAKMVRPGRTILATPCLDYLVSCVPARVSLGSRSFRARRRVFPLFRVCFARAVPCFPLFAFVSCAPARVTLGSHSFRARWRAFPSVCVCFVCAGDAFPLHGSGSFRAPARVSHGSCLFCARLRMFPLVPVFVLHARARVSLG